MTWGQGHGVPFGGVITSDPVDRPSQVAGQPITFDFTDEPDGPLPGMWESYIWNHDIAGVVTTEAESNIDAYFKVSNGLGFWDYSVSPKNPDPGEAFSERGFAAGPRGVLTGRNHRVTVIVRQPVGLLDASVDEFHYSVGIALRSDLATVDWVGARMRAEWAAGTWTTPLVLEIVQSVAGVETVLVTETPTPEPDLLNIWRDQPDAELEVELRNTTLVATLSGIIVATAQVPAPGGSQAMLMIEARNVLGLFSTASPVLVAVQFQSLRDFSALGPPPQIHGAPHLEAPEFPMMRLPIRDLLDANLLKQLRGRQFQFTQDTEVSVQHQTFRFDAGEVIRIRERLGSQEFIPSTRDLFYERNRNRS